MEIQPLSIEHILRWLQQHAADRKASLVARIAISPEQMQLLDMQPENPLAVIHY